jgi:hypothetical protein
VADEAIGNFRRGVMLRYATQKPNLRVKRSCTGLGNSEVFLFSFIVSKGLCSQMDSVCLLYDWSDVM